MLSATLENNKQFSSQYAEYIDVFFEEKTNTLSKHESHNHAIDTDDRDSFFDSIYNLSTHEFEVLRKYIDENLKKNFITLFIFSASVSILFVKKSDKSLRLCVDYRKLNVITIKNRFSLFLVSEILDRLIETRVYIKLNFRIAYNQIRIKKDDEWKTTFRCRFEHFEYRVMSFELVNAFVTFQSYINKTLHIFLDIFALMYLDDILIYFLIIEKHEDHVKSVLQRLRQHELYVKLKKCAFSISKIDFLKFRISAKDIFMKKARVKIIKNWLESLNHRDIQMFLKFVNFYRRFIEIFSRVIADLTELLKEKKKEKFFDKFELTSKARKSFNNLKKIFMKTSLLWHFNLDLKIMIETNVIEFVIFEIISQLDSKTDQWHSIVFWSRKMTSAERNYMIDETEMLAIVEVCKKWRHYIESFKHSMRVITDHVNFRTFLIIKALSRREARWWERLSDLNLKIEYKSNKTNSADALSRRSDYESDEQNISNSSSSKAEWLSKYKNNATVLRSDNTDDSSTEDNVLKTSKWILLILENAEFLVMKTEIIESVLIERRRLTKDEKSTTQSSREVDVSNSSEIIEKIDDESKNSLFNDEISSEITISSALISRTVIEEVFESSTSSRDTVLLAAVNRALIYRKNKSIKRTKLHEFDRRSRLFQLVSTENCENLVFKNAIREISERDSTFAVASIELRIVLQALQKIDSLAQRVRSLVERAKMKRKSRNKKSEASSKSFSDRKKRSQNERQAIKWSSSQKSLRTWKSDTWKIIFCAEERNDTYSQIF